MAGDWQQGYSGQAPKGVAPNNIKRLKPGTLLVRTPDKDIIKIGKLFVPRTSSLAKEKSTVGVVVQMASWLETEPQWLFENNVVMYGRYTGAEITFAEDPHGIYRVLEPNHVFFVIHDNADEYYKAEADEEAA
jgi:hypothetical protein